MTDLDAARKGVRVGITWRNSRPACMADIIMANRRIAMRKIRQVLRLALEAGASRRRIAKSLGLSRDVVTDYLTRAGAAGLVAAASGAHGQAGSADRKADERPFPV